MFVRVTTKDCGTGAGGFQPGNTCGAGASENRLPDGAIGNGLGRYMLANRILAASRAGEQFALLGNTYPVKDELRKLGAEWNPTTRVWLVDPKIAMRAQRIVDEAQYAASTRGGDSPAQARPEPRPPSAGPGPATANQLRLLNTLMGKRSKIGRLDSVSNNTGASIGRVIQQTVAARGDKLTSREASALIDEALSAIDDEM